MYRLNATHSRGSGRFAERDILGLGGRWGRRERHVLRLGVKQRIDGRNERECDER